MSLELSRIRGLCFDVDGTLSDTDDLYTQKVQSLLPPLLFPEPARTARRFVMWAEAPGNTLLTLTDIIGLDDEIVAIVHWFNRLRRARPKKFLLIPGVDAMLERLHGHYPMAVVSARDEDGTMAFLNQFELVKYFDAIITGLSAKHTKPYPDPVRLAAQKMGLAPEACLMIGDTTVDIRAGKSAGTKTVGVLCGFGEEPELKRMGADMILNATPDLVDVLLKN